MSAWCGFTLTLLVWRFADGVDRCLRTPRSPAVALGIDVNRATPAELRLLPGFGVVRARAVVLERLRGGRFERVEDLDRVAGIGPETVRRIAPWVRIVP